MPDDQSTPLLAFLTTATPQHTADLLQKIVSCVQALFDCASLQSNSSIARHIASNSKGYVPLELILAQPPLQQLLANYGVTIPPPDLPTLSHHLQQHIKTRPCRLWANPTGLRLMRPHPPKHYPPVLLQNFDTENNHEELQALLQSVCQIDRIDYEPWLNSATVHTPTPEKLLPLEGYPWPICQRKMRVSLHEQAQRNIRNMRSSAALFHLMHSAGSRMDRRKEQPYPCMMKKYAQQRAMPYGRPETDYDSMDENEEELHWRRPTQQPTQSTAEHPPKDQIE